MEVEMMADNIHDAAVQGRDEEVRQLVSADPSALDARDARLGATPLMWACFHGEESTARLLLSLGADLHVTGSRGISALLLACRRGHWPVVRLLLAQGADPCVCVEDGSHVLMHAASGGSVDIVRALLQHTRHQVNVCSVRGYSALSWACSAGHTDVAQVLLLEGGARPELVTVTGKGPMDVAQAKGHKECVALLQWFSRECGRSLWLCKARAVADLCHSLALSPHTPLPSYFEQRPRPCLPTLTLNLPPPSVCKGEGLKRKWEGQQEVREGPHSPTRQDDKEAFYDAFDDAQDEAQEEPRRPVEGPSEGPLGCVLRHVVVELGNDVFSELVALLKPGEWAAPH